MSPSISLPAVFLVLVLVGWVSYPIRGHTLLDALRYLLAGALLVFLSYVALSGACEVVPGTYPWFGAFHRDAPRLLVELGIFPAKLLRIPSGYAFPGNPLATVTAWVGLSLVLSWAVGKRRSRGYKSVFVAYPKDNPRSAGDVIEIARSRDNNRILYRVLVKYTADGARLVEERDDAYDTVSRDECREWDESAFRRKFETVIPRELPQSPIVRSVVVVVNDGPQQRLVTAHRASGAYLGRIELPGLKVGSCLSLSANTAWRGRQFESAVPLVSNWPLDREIPRTPAPRELRGSVDLDSIAVEPPTKEKDIARWLELLKQKKNEPGVVPIVARDGLNIYLLATTGGAAELKVAWKEDDVIETIERVLRGAA